MKIELIVFALISSVLSNNIANKVEEVIRQFISAKRLEVSQGVARINEVLRNHNAEAAKYLIRAHDKINSDNLQEILNQEIDRLHDFDYDRIEEMAFSSIENLEELAKIVTNECVIKYWNDYIDDVLKALSAIDVHQCYGKHEVMNCAMALAKKIQDGSNEITDELLLLQLAINFATSEVKERLRSALETAEIEHLFHIRVESC